MRQLFIGTLAILMTCSFAAAAPRTGAGGSGAPGRVDIAGKEYKLPKDPKSVVISLDFKGGYGPRRKNNAPSLSILANGTILMPDNYGMSKDVKSEMSKKELQELLEFIVEKNQFLKYNKVKVAAAKKKALKPKKGPGGFIGISPVVSDACNDSYLCSRQRQRSRSNGIRLKYVCGWKIQGH